MGFFQSLKEDLGAAMNELMSDEERELDLESPDVDAGEYNELLEGMDLDLSIGEAMAIANGEERENIMTSEELSEEEQSSIDSLLADLDAVDEIAEEELAEEELSEEELTEEELTEEDMEADLEDVAESLEDADSATEEEQAVVEEKSTRDALDSLKNASMRFEEKQKNEDMANVVAPTIVVAETNEETVEEAEEVTTEETANEAEAVEVKAETAAKAKSEDYDFTYSDDTAVITEGMKLKGDIESDGNLDILGHVTGNVKIVGKLNCFGSIEGNIEAHEIFVDGARIKGNINVSGSIKVGKSSVICGNLSSTSAVVAGAVKGDIDVTGPVILDSTAIILGDIKSMTMQVNNGAAIEGRCSQCYAKVSPEAFFKDFND